MGNDPRHRIELTASLGDELVVAGWTEWSLSEARLEGGEAGVADPQAVFWLRGDVAQAFGLPEGGRYGFAVLVPAGLVRGTLILIGTGASLRLDLAGLRPVPASADLLSERKDVAALLARAMAGRTPGKPDFDRLAVVLADRNEGPVGARGSLDRAIEIVTTKTVLVLGWCGAIEGMPVWLETDGGTVLPLGGEKVYRFDRNDVAGVLAEELLPWERPGFVTYFEADAPVQRVRLRALGRDGVHCLAQVAVGYAEPDPRSLAKFLFAIDSPLGDFARRCEILDLPVVDAAMRGRRRRLEALPVQERGFGRAVQEPAASIVVPLYGRHDFMEGQLMAFRKDPWIGSNAEIVYVVDDPKLIDAVLTDGEYWSVLYDVSFRVLWTGENQGYSGANTIGARYARGRDLVFLNSDVFPTKPGWVERMTAHLAPRGAFGIVGARLSFPDGAIQHDGMASRHLPEFGIRINDHPRMGLDPDLVDASPIRSVEAVTGACLAIPKAILEEVGGWSGDYLLGDFEDSDLCQAVRRAGHDIGLVSDVSLVHLERQSVSLLGDGAFRQRLTILNAVRHMRRWPATPEQAAGGTATAE